MESSSSVFGHVLEKHPCDLLIEFNVGIELLERLGVQVHYAELIGPLQPSVSRGQLRHKGKHFGVRSRPSRYLSNLAQQTIPGTKGNDDGTILERRGDQKRVDEGDLLLVGEKRDVLGWGLCFQIA